MANGQRKHKNSDKVKNLNLEQSPELESGAETFDEMTTQGYEEVGQPAQITKSSYADQLPPVVQDAYRFLDGEPVKAALLGAAIGGLVGSVIATEKGRSLVKLGLTYANPLLTNYAREVAGKIATGEKNLLG